MSRSCGSCGQLTGVEEREDLTELFFFFDLDKGTIEPYVPSLCDRCYQRIHSLGYRIMLSNRVFNNKYDLVVRSSQEGLIFSVRLSRRKGPLACWVFVSETSRSHDFFDTYTLYNARGVELIVTTLNKFSTVAVRG